MVLQIIFLNRKNATTKNVLRFFLKHFQGHFGSQNEVENAEVQNLALVTKSRRHVGRMNKNLLALKKTLKLVELYYCNCKSNFYGPLYNWKFQFGTVT